MEWFRAYHGISVDPKWALIARKSGQPKSVVLAVWLYVLDFASQAGDRGSIASIDPELVDVLYDLDDGATALVLDAMLAKGIITEDKRIAAWDKRQPAKEDAVGPEAKSAAQRKREQRARDREKSHGESQDVTQCHAESRHVTQCHAPDTDTEKDKEEIHTPLPPSPGGGVCASPAPLSGEDIAEAQDAVQAERRRGDYEFSLLRAEYDKARQEGPMAGRQEFLQLFASPDFPGLDEILAGLQRLLESDDQFRRGYAPGLSRFLRERMWAMRPRAPAGQEREPEKTPEELEAERKIAEMRAKRKAREAERKRGQGWTSTFSTAL